MKINSLDVLKVEYGVIWHETSCTFFSTFVNMADALPALHLNYHACLIKAKHLLRGNSSSYSDSSLDGKWVHIILIMFESKPVE